ncbi:O-antigen ligase family protein [Aquisphaera insulae]|uniref:O-antigen ligase family protein n=1 Tax=Aquisphaera insulae TaxID=2712864 RepID=UPI0013EDA147|nr:O-antigen ligase family protein [Aquisphaera insulae]
MIYLLIGYMWLFVHRPFEIWSWMGSWHIERIYLIFTAAYWLIGSPGKTWINNRLIPAFFFFGITFVLAYVASPYQNYLTSSRTFEEYPKLFVFFVLALTSIHSERDLRLLTTGYLVILGLYMSHSLLEFHRGRHVYRMGIPRMIGVDETFNDPNTFAATILYSLPLSLPFWPEASTRRRLLILYYMGLSVACILLTGSRSGLAGLICFGALCFRRLLGNWKVLFLVAAAVPLSWSVLPDNLKDRFRSIFDPSVGPKNAQESAEGRLTGLYDGIALWQGSPVLGVGPGAHGAATGLGMQSHNLYGQVLGETGTLGALGLLSIIAGFALNAMEARRLARHRPSPDSQFLAGLSMSILMSVGLLLFKGYSDHNLYRYTWLWFGLFQAAAVQFLRGTPEGAEPVWEDHAEGGGVKALRSRRCVPYAGGTSSV